jgi:hypothetical protein
MRRLIVFAIIGTVCVLLALGGYRAYDSYQTDRTVDAVYDWMTNRGTATPTSKTEIRAQIADVQSRYGISAEEARKLVAGRYGR